MSSCNKCERAEGGGGEGSRVRRVRHQEHIGFSSVADPDPNPDPSDPYVFEHPGFFYHQANKVRKTLIPIVCYFFLTFYL